MHPAPAAAAEVQEMLRAACCQSSPDGFSFNRTIAYKGSVGKLREAFCANYATVKKNIILDIERNHRQDAASLGKPISCSKGCSACCSLYIAASLQECECIVYYLYHHNETLRNFLRAYDAWIGRITRIESCFDRINSLHGRPCSRRKALRKDTSLMPSRPSTRAKYPMPFPV